MADNPDIRHGRDRVRINVNQDHELHYWSKKLHTTRERLKEAVQAVGDEANKVEAHLKGSRSKTNGDRLGDA